MFTIDESVCINNMVCGIYLGLFSTVPGVQADDAANMSRVYIGAYETSEDGVAFKTTGITIGIYNGLRNSLIMV